MNKKIIFAMLLMLVAAISIASVCASDNITIEGILFNIPDGFEKINSTSDTTFFEDDNGGEYSISIENSTIFVNRGPKTINGVEGSLLTSADTEGKVKFEYPIDEKIVTIITTDESLLEKIIPES